MEPKKDFFALLTETMNFDTVPSWRVFIDMKYNFRCCVISRKINIRYEKKKNQSLLFFLIPLVKYCFQTKLKQLLIFDSLPHHKTEKKEIGMCVIKTNSWYFPL